MTCLTATPSTKRENNNLALKLSSKKLDRIHWNISTIFIFFFLFFRLPTAGLMETPIGILSFTATFYRWLLRSKFLRWCTLIEFLEWDQCYILKCFCLAYFYFWKGNKEFQVELHRTYQDEVLLWSRKCLSKVTNIEISLLRAWVSPKEDSFSRTVEAKFIIIIIICVTYTCKYARRSTIMEEKVCCMEYDVMNSVESLENLMILK